jgi:phosphate transport system substrate-binding protein
MQAFSPEWSLGSGKSVKWPTGVGQKGNAGVAGVIKNRVGAIGYVNQSFVKGNVVAAAVQKQIRGIPEAIGGVRSDRSE